MSELIVMLYNNLMRKLLVAMFVALLVVGCGSDSTPSGSTDTPKAIDLDDNETRNKIIAEAIDLESLQHRDDKDGKDLFYNPKEQTPYTGWVKEMRNEKVKSLAQYKSGKADGPWTEWDENGHNIGTVYFKEGERDGLSIFYYKDGAERNRTTYKDGKLKTIVVWKPNGEKCPVTNVANGNGVMVWYYADGTERNRITYKDGLKVRD